MDKSRYDRPTTRTLDQIIEDGYRIAEGKTDAEKEAQVKLLEQSLDRLSRARVEGPVFKWDSDKVPEYRKGTHFISVDWSVAAWALLEYIETAGEP